MRTTLNIENESVSAIRNYAEATIAIAILTAHLATSASAAEVMPTTQQNALVQKYCTMCHTDVVKNGGLSLQHFDVAIAPRAFPMGVRLCKGCARNKREQSCRGILKVWISRASGDMHVWPKQHLPVRNSVTP